MDTIVWQIRIDRGQKSGKIATTMRAHLVVRFVVLFCNLMLPHILLIIIGTWISSLRVLLNCDLFLFSTRYITTMLSIRHYSNNNDMVRVSLPLQRMRKQFPYKRTIHGHMCAVCGLWQTVWRSGIETIYYQEKLWKFGKTLFENKKKHNLKLKKTF